MEMLKVPIVTSNENISHRIIMTIATSVEQYQNTVIVLNYQVQIPSHFRIPLILVLNPDSTLALSYVIFTLAYSWSQLMIGYCM